MELADAVIPAIFRHTAFVLHNIPKLLIAFVFSIYDDNLGSVNRPHKGHLFICGSKSTGMYTWHNTYVVRRCLYRAVVAVIVSYRA